MTLEDQIAMIIKEEYAADGYEDEGRSGAAARKIMILMRESPHLTEETWDERPSVPKL